MATLDKLEAPTVTVFVDSDRKPAKVEDKRLPDYVLHRIGIAGILANVILDSKTVNQEIPLSGEMYGFKLPDLLPRLKTLDLSDLRSAAVSVNDDSDVLDLNSIIERQIRLVKLDVGHWGAYHRERETSKSSVAAEMPQRDFGVVDGLHVFLCRFNSFGKAKTNSATDLLPLSRANAVFKAIEARGCGVELVSHTVASLLSVDMAQQPVCIFLPDFHLPEKFPERPALAPGQATDPAFVQLQKNLRLAQKQPSTLTNPLSVSDQDKIQAHIEAIDTFLAAPPGTLVEPQFPVVSIAGPSALATTTNIGVKDFLAAQALVDRSIILESCWFYSDGPGGDGDPGPAVDLVNFLSALKKVDPSIPIKVIQVGDLYELWLNREFLYRDFPVVDPKAGSGFKLGLIATTASIGQDLPQYRMDEGWTDTAGVSHGSKRYVFHEWKTDPLLFRNLTGTNREVIAHTALFPIPSSDNTAAVVSDVFADIQNRLARCRRLLEERVDGVKSFSLPKPTTSAAGLITAAEIATLRVVNAQGNEEVLWNQMIVNLLNDLSFDNVYGNHDGYRGDSLINGLLSSSDQGKPFISLPGLWCEHSHRWDDYNRDGMAFGAGVTNMVYYYRKRLLGADRVKDNIRLPWVNEPQEQACYIPGSALWFLLGLTQAVPSLPPIPNLNFFGIYVGGHTHDPTLVTVLFDLTLGAKASKAASDAANTLGNALNSAREGIEQFEEEAGKALTPVVDPTLGF